ncbi:TPA: hypothetical protein IX136_002561 [Enterococcus faecium]|nr:hypothetical protein [Enterococcus faecium]HAQ5599067.1 hypothetical protein [Enterococcus faecium]HAQ5992888.1 hypothetical protein [Enterococcus faecium]HAQ6051018.1 hypothetical protein [Enterococcus faecium]HAQ7932664.1 hypothetical protein [Enterococcus faecium]
MAGYGLGYTSRMTDIRLESLEHPLFWELRIKQVSTSEKRADSSGPGA